MDVVIVVESDMSAVPFTSITGVNSYVVHYVLSPSLVDLVTNHKAESIIY